MDQIITSKVEVKERDNVMIKCDQDDGHGKREGYENVFKIQEDKDNLVCPLCGCKDRISKEEGQIVCTDCGCVLADSDHFKHDPTQELTTNSHHLFCNLTVPRGVRNNLPRSKLSNARKMAMRKLETLIVELNESSGVKNDATMRLEETIAHKTFYSVQKNAKEILAGVCVYIAMMKQNKHIAITQICNAIGCDTHEFGKIYNQVVQFFPEYKPAMTCIEDLVPVTLSEATLDSNERERLQERVVEMIRLQKDLWLIEGRSPIHLIFAAAYWAWKSLDPYSRLKVKLTQFCDRLHISYKHTTSERVTELYNALAKLASNIPGGIKINKQNIALYIEDILKYRNSLMYDLNLQIKNEREKNGGEEDSSTQWGTAFKRKAKENERQEDRDKNADSTLNNGSDEEIDDAEIDGYLRSAKEIRLIKRLKKALTPTSE